MRQGEGHVEEERLFALRTVSDVFDGSVGQLAVNPRSCIVVIRLDHAARPCLSTLKDELRLKRLGVASLGIVALLVVSHRQGERIVGGALN